MRHRCLVLLRCALVIASLISARALSAQVSQVAELTTRQIRALDRVRTVVILQGGMLEEHGPYLPAFTDGILSARLTSELAAGIVRRRPGWTVLVFPPIAAGASGSNEIGRQYTFAGTYALRPSTLRATFVDLASELGEQGFRWVAQDYRQAPSVSGANYANDFAAARLPGWPGYLGAPQLATAAFGEKIWRAFAEATIKTSVEILDGKDAASYPRYLTYLKKLPEYRDWIDSSNARDALAATRQLLPGSA